MAISLTHLGLAAYVVFGAAPKPGGDVQIEGWRWKQLVDAPAEPDSDLPGPWASRRDVVLERVEGGIEVRSTWIVRSVDEGWFDGIVLGRIPGGRIESVRWKGKAASVATGPEGQVVAREFGRGKSGRLEMRAFIPWKPDDGPIAMSLLPAVKGKLRVDGGELESTVKVLGSDEPVPRVRRAYWVAERVFEVSLSEPVDEVDAADDRPLALGQAAMGMTFGDGALEGRARVTWVVRRGALDRVSIATGGLGADLELTGPNVRSWKKNGSTIEVELREPERHRVAVELRWTQSLPSGDEKQIPAPRVSPEGAWRSEHYLQIARDGELEVVPKLSGWEGVRAAELPSWADGLIAGTATASYRGSDVASESSFDLLRFVPVSGPPVVVDVAAYEIAATDEGRMLIRAQYEVRNERASHLHLTPPEGMRIIGARVGGEVVVPARAEGGTWLLPLMRSVESLEGLLSFPVEAILIAQSETWDRKESRTISLPSVDAPIAASRTRLFLPPGYSSRLDVGDSDVVSSFSEGEGITYGLGVGDVGVVAADAKYREALSAYMSNDFEEAQRQIDELEDMGASNRNVEGLRANLEVVQGKGKAEGKKQEAEREQDGRGALLERRIKQQAQARAVEDKREQVRMAQEAKRLEAEGRYDEAEEKFQQAIELGGRLEHLEQEESVEQRALNQDLDVQFKKVAERKARRKRREIASRSGVGGLMTKNSRKMDKVSESVDGSYQAGESGGAGGGDEGEFLPASGRAIELDAKGLGEDDDGKAKVPASEETEIVSQGAFLMVEQTDEEAAKTASGEDMGGEGAADPGDVFAAAVRDEAVEYEYEPEPESEFSRVRVRGRSKDRSRSRGGKRKAAKVAAAPPMQTPTPDPQPARKPKPGANAAAPLGRPMPAGTDAPDAPVITDTTTVAAPPPPPGSAAEPPAMNQPDDANAALPEPTVTASALSVVVPAIGEAVLYQRLLLPAGEHQQLEIEAKAPLRTHHRKKSR